MTTLKIGQLTNYCEEEAVDKKFYPVSLLQSIYDARTGVRLDRLLSAINSIYLPYAGAFGSTMIQVPLKSRRVGLIVTYKDLLGVTSTVRYKSTNTTINDEAWSNKDNWEGWSFDNVINDLAEALNIVFNDITNYPDVKAAIDDQINTFIKSYVETEDIKQQFVDVLNDSIIAAAKEQTEDVWHNVCNYEELNNLINDSVTTVINTIFNDLDTHLNIKDLITTSVSEAMVDSVIEATKQIYASIDDYEDVREVLISAIDNKVHDVFYNVLDYKDVADIIRTEWQNKLDNMQDDDGIKELINTLVHDYLKKLLTDTETYPEVAKVFNTYVAETTKNIFLNVSKYAELVGTIESSLHDVVELMIDDIDAHTTLVNVIRQAVKDYICEQFQIVSTNTNLGKFINDCVINTIKDLFADLDNNPDVKDNFDRVISESLKEVVDNIDDYPKVKKLLDKLARDNRINIQSYTSTKTFTFDEVNNIHKGDTVKTPVEESIHANAKVDDLVIIEANVSSNTDGAPVYKLFIFGKYVEGVERDADITVEVYGLLHAPYDYRIDNIIKSVGLEADGTGIIFDDPLPTGGMTVKQVVEELLKRIQDNTELINNNKSEFDKYVEDANNKFVHSDTIGESNGIPSLDENGEIEDKFINDKYYNVYHGKFITNLMFTDMNGNKLPSREDTIYIDDTTDITYYWKNGKYVVCNPQIKVGDNIGDAFDAYRGNQLEEFAISCPKNIVTDIKDAERYKDNIQIKYRGVTKGDHQHYVKAFRRVVTLHAATESLAGLLLPEDKYTLNHIEEVFMKFIEEHKEEILDKITPDGYQFVVVKEGVGMHNVLIPPGLEVVRVKTREPKIWEKPEDYTNPVFVPNPNSVEDNYEIDRTRIIKVPDGYDPVIVDPDKTNE